MARVRIALVFVLGLALLTTTAGEVWGAPSAAGPIVAQGPATLTTQASPAVSVGGTIWDTATVNGYVPGATVTGRVIFRLYGPDNPTCAEPSAFTSGRRVEPDGTARSDDFTPTAPGTYRWQANFTGDTNNPPISRTACNDPNEQTVVTPPPPSITTQASPSVSVGGTIFDSATVSPYVPGADPQGRVIFRLYGPDNPTCAEPAAFTSGDRVDENGNARSEDFTPTAPGTYRWQANFTGDTNNPPISRTDCADPNEQTVVTAAGAPSPIAVYRPSSSTWYFFGGPAVQFGIIGDIQVPGDYNGDSNQDVAVFRPSDGVWYVQGGAAVAWGTSGDIPVPADYDGNGTTDRAVFRPSTSTWFVEGGPTVVWGTTGDIPVPGDYDGNGSAEIAILRPSTSTWFVQGGPTVVWGTTGDIPVPAHYDADSTTDIAVFRPSTGTWFVFAQFGGLTENWGTAGDIPVPANYDLDGTDEIAVFRPSTGTWYVDGGATVPFGAAGDRPLPLPYAIQNVFFP